MFIINVKSYGAIGDGSNDDRVAVQNAANVAIATGQPLYFPKGTYKMVSVGGSRNHCLEIAAASSWMHWFGDCATIMWDSSQDHPNTGCCVLVDVGSTKITIEGLAFQGFTDIGADDFMINSGCAFFFQGSVIDVNIDRCYFDHACPFFFASDDISSRCVFSRNRVINSPLGVALPSYSKVTDNWFHCDSVVLTRSHAIYLYGRVEHCIITGNHFKNIANETIQVRATDTYRQQKRDFVIANNHFEGDAQYAIWVASDERINGGSFVITGNVFKNSGGPAQLVGLRDSIFSNNVCEWDYMYAAAPGQAIAVGSSNPNAISSGLRIENNILVNRHPYFCTIVISSEPKNGDTVTIGSVTYTWRNSPSIPGDVQIDPNIDQCAINLSERIGGHTIKSGDPAYTPINPALRDSSDTFHSQKTSGEGLVVVASDRTFTVSKTGASALLFTTTRKASLYVGRLGSYYDTLWNSTYQAKLTGIAGNSIEIAAVGDAGTGAGTLDDTAGHVIFHYKPGVSTVADMNALAVTSTQIEVGIAGTTTNILDADAAFGADAGKAQRFLVGGSDDVRDATNYAAPGILLNTSRDCVIANNTLTAVGQINLNGNIRPRVINNDFHEGGGPNGSGISSRGNMFPYFEGARSTPLGYNVPGSGYGLGATHLLSSYDAFPVIRNCELTGRSGVDGGTQDMLLPSLMGASGIVPVGDKKAFGFLYYGNEQFVDQGDGPARPFRWVDGDIVKFGDDHTTYYTFTFARSISDATSQFNSYATLTSLINTRTDGNWAATNPVDTYFGSDPLAFGYIMIKATVAGAHPGAAIWTSGADNTRQSMTCGVILKYTAELLAYSPMMGNEPEAAVTKTVFYTPLASKIIPLLVVGVDAASQALDPVAYQADVIPGVCYVITHAFAAGTEKFFVKVGG